MTGRDLILYIVSNGLEDEEFFKDGKLLGFMTAIEAAIKFNVGIATIKVWVEEGHLDGFKIGKEIYIPANAERPNKDVVSNYTANDLYLAFCKVMEGSNA